MVLNNYYLIQKISFNIKGRLIPEVGIICLFLLLNIFPFISFASSQSNCSEQFFDANHSTKVQIKKIYDGDTVKLSDNRKVRLIGVNTPELDYHYGKHQSYAIEAHQKLKKLLNNKQIKLIWGRERQDKYNRYLAYAFSNEGNDVQKHLLEQGLATSIVVLPNDRQLACYRSFEAKARIAGRGIWQLHQYRPIKAEQVKHSLRGYRFIQGEIKGFKHFRKATLLRLSDSFNIYIRHEVYPGIVEVLSAKKILGRKVKVRGWVKPYKGKPQIRLSHPLNIELE